MSSSRAAPAARRLAALAALALAAGTVASPVRAQQVNTGTPPLGTEGREALRLSGFFSNQVAQTFVAPTGLGTLTQFQFWAGNELTFQNLSYRAYVFAWDDALRRPVAAPIWSSGLITGTVPMAPTAVTVDVPSLVLAPGQRYAAVLSALESPSPVGNAIWGGRVFLARGTVNGQPQNTYDGGVGYLLQTPNTAQLSALWTNAWQVLGNGQDFAFTATFATPQNVVPEPASVVLLGSGVAALGLVARRRQRR